MRTVFLLLLTMTSVSLLNVPSFAQGNPDYQLSLSSGSGEQGSSVDLVVSFDNTGSTVRGWAFGVCSDPSQVTIVEVVNESGTNTSNNGGLPDFVEINIIPEAWSGSVIIDLFGGIGLDPGLGYLLNRATYSLDGNQGTVASIEFCVYPGVPPITPVIIIGSISETPTMIDGTITIGAGFIRGECNGLSSINLADPIFLLGFLFIDPVEPPCRDACDLNDDGSINLADPIYLLSHLFSGGPPPLPPFPDCGDDSTDDALDCGSFSICP